MISTYVFYRRWKFHMNIAILFCQMSVTKSKSKKTVSNPDVRLQ